MVELIGKDQLFDEALTRMLGPVDAFVADAIVEICNDALEGVLGPVLVAVLVDDRHRLPLVASWVWDLASGLHFQARNGPREPPTRELIAQLGDRHLGVEELRRFAETVDLATVLTLDRLLEQVLGPGACARVPKENEVALPWLAGLKLGYRIRLALELLRLSPSR